MAYSPHTPRTPRTPRAMVSSSAPPTPHVGYTVPERTHVHNHHYAGILMHHDSSNSDSSMGYISPTHRTLGTSYGTMQTEVSGGCPQASRHLVVEIPSLDDTSLHSQIVLRKSVAWIWVIINIVVFGLCAFCLLQPNWLTNDSTQASVGLFNYCEEGASLSTELEKCRYYSADANSKITLHSLSWQIAAVVYTISCSIFGISALVTTLCLCISDISLVNKLCLLAGLHQLISGVYEPYLTIYSSYLY